MTEEGGETQEEKLRSGAKSAEAKSKECARLVATGHLMAGTGRVQAHLSSLKLDAHQEHH